LYYNLDVFGKELKKIRKNLNLSKQEIARKALVSEKTIRRYESGKTTPIFEILETLSPFYKMDLVKLLIQYRLDDYSVFCSIKKRIEIKLGNKENDLNMELKDLNILLASTKNNYFIDLINQLTIFIEALKLINNKELYLAYEKFVKAIKVTNPHFNIDKYTSYMFSSMEIRILMNIALVFYQLDNRAKYMEILEFCISAIEYTDEVCPLICNNLAGAYIRNQNYQEALEYSNIGIQSCIENQISSCLYNLYYTKGCAEYRLNLEGYIESLKTSIYLCKANKKSNLEYLIIEKCKDYLDIDLSQS
jgi:transcriptional regulator with XRE-family HTH domain